MVVLDERRIFVFYRKSNYNFCQKFNDATGDVKFLRRPVIEGKFVKLKEGNDATKKPRQGMAIKF